MGAEEWLEWGKVEEGLEWRNSGSGGMGKEEEWLDWGNGWGGGGTLRDACLCSPFLPELVIGSSHSVARSMWELREFQLK